MNRLCSECPNELPGNDIRRKTCSASCRAKRSRRLKRIKSEAGKSGGNTATAEQREVAQRVRGEVADVAHQVIEEELRPVVREALTEEVLQAIARMVALTPRAVDRIGEDLENDDPAIRQRAYNLIAKYTLGHPAILQPKDAEAGRAMNINFNLPRPGDEVDESLTAVPSEIEEVRECDQCHEDKPITQFIAGSDRCATCYHSNQERAEKLLEATKRR